MTRNGRNLVSGAYLGRIIEIFTANLMRMWKFIQKQWNGNYPLPDKYKMVDGTAPTLKMVK